MFPGSILTKTEIQDGRNFLIIKYRRFGIALESKCFDISSPNIWYIIYGGLSNVTSLAAGKNVLEIIYLYIILRLGTDGIGLQLKNGPIFVAFESIFMMWKSTNQQFTNQIIIVIHLIYESADVFVKNSRWPVSNTHNSLPTTFLDLLKELSLNMELTQNSFLYCFQTNLFS